MLQSPLMKGNPSLYAFLPIIYTVWSDAVLTPEEMKAVHELINKQDWVTEEEKKFLKSQVNPESPPRPAEMKAWISEIRKVSSEVAKNKKDGLIEMGIRLAKLHAAKDATSLSEEQHRMFKHLEDALGIISRESVFNLVDIPRNSLTEQLKTRHTFDINELTNILDGDQAELIGKVKTTLQHKDFEYFETDDLSERREKVLAWCHKLAEHGYGALAYPKMYGGMSDMKGYFTVMETLSYHDLSLVIKFGVQFGLFGMSVYFLGTEKHHRKYLNDIGSLKLPGCFAMTETGHGSNVRGIETTATYDYESKTITIHTPTPHARKEYIGNAASHGRMATVFAKLIVKNVDYGVAAFLVPLRDEFGNTLHGITIEDCGRKMGLNGVDNGIINFNKVVIPLENMLDRFTSITDDGEFSSPISSDNKRFFTMLGTLVGGRIGIPRSALSAAKSGLAITIRYADQRRQFGPEGGSEVPILNYRTYQRRIIPLLANAYALHFSLQYLTERFLKRTDEDMQEIEALAAGLKSFATWNTTDTLQECREACGGKGYLSENRIDDLKNDTDIFTTFEGDNYVLMQLVAKSRLTEFKQEFSNINFFGILNYVTSQAKTSLSEMNPIIIRSTDEEHLLDPEFHISAFKYRERDILTSAARRLKRHLDDGMDSFDALNVCQHHLINVGTAYIERIILEQFQLAVENCNNKDIKVVLGKLCSMFALSHIEKNRGWYLEQGYMEGVKTKAIRKLKNQLCWELREHAVPLVDAFAIPDKLLSAPIAINTIK